MYDLNDTSDRQASSIMFCVYLNIILLSTACHVIPFSQYIFIREISLFVLSIPVLLLLSLKPFNLSLFVSLALNLFLPLRNFVSLHLMLFFFFFFHLQVVCGQEGRAQGVQSAPVALWQTAVVEAELKWCLSPSVSVYVGPWSHPSPVTPKKRFRHGMIYKLPWFYFVLFYY